jgi:ubiquinone/menaquinone biosynthesis C-methylase UbiE
VVRVEAVEPDEAMLAAAEPSLAKAPVPIRLARAPVEALPFPAAQFDSVVVTLVFCSVADPERGLHEIRRVLKPGGALLLLEHVRGQGTVVPWIQDALAPLTTRCMGHCHWNRNTQQLILGTGFQITQIRQLSGGLQPMLFIQATRPETLQDLSAQSSHTAGRARRQ